MLGPDDEIEIKEGVPIAVGKHLIFIGEIKEDAIPEKFFSDDVQEMNKSTGQFEKLDRPLTMKKNMALINKAHEYINDPLDINEFSEKILDGIFNLLIRVERGAIIFAKSGTSEIVKVISKYSENYKGNGNKYNPTIVNSVLNKGLPVIMQESFVQNEENQSDESIPMEIGSALCVPMRSNRKVIGAIYLDSINDFSCARKDDLELISGIGAITALAFENKILRKTLRQLKKQAH